jgi:hypothetical protein
MHLGACSVDKWPFIAVRAWEGQIRLTQFSAFRPITSNLKNILKAFKHVSLTEMSTNRSYYTKHGLHMNNFEKERFAKQSAIQIAMLTKVSDKSESIIPLKWKEETTSLNNIPDEEHENSIMTVKTDSVESLIPSTQTPNNQNNKVNNETLCRFSIRNKKKVPLL